MIWFTSDTHFNHTNVIKYCNRPFSSLEEMNEIIIFNWNQLVKPEDTIYHLGDFGFFRKDNTISKEEIFKQLNGQKILILGNHDHNNRVKSLPWHSVQTLIESLKYQDKEFVLFHYPIEDWNKKFHGAIHLHGHSHGTCSKMSNRIDVGVDCWNYAPVSIDTIITFHQGK